MDFKEISIDDYEIISPYMDKEESLMCDYTFVSLYMWRNYYHTTYAIYEDILFIRHEYQNKTFFLLPCGDYHKGISILKKAFGSINLIAVSKEKASSINGEKKTDDSWNDYLYLGTDLKELTGKKYKQKRNHVNTFIREYDYKFTLNDEEGVYDFIDKIDAEEGSLLYEKKEIIELIKNRDKLNISYGKITINGVVAALTIGFVYKDTLYVNVEKGDRKYKGIFEIINYEFANNMGEYKYINREDDMGILGIRLAKESYHPFMMIEKYNIEMSD